MPWQPKVGDRVLVGAGRVLAVVVRLYPGIPGGVRIDRLVEGFVSWNVGELRRAEKTGGEKE